MTATQDAERATRTAARTWDATVVVRRTRLASGLILFFYVSCHLANHVFGLWSLDLLESARVVFLAFWRAWPATVVLYAALAAHILLALWAVYRRDHFRRIKMEEAYQLVLGFAVPLLLLEHVVGTRYVHEVYGVEDSYTYVLLVHWMFEPKYAVQQTAALLVAWTHGCVGLHLVLRFEPWYRARLPYLYAIAVLLPALSLAGYVDGGLDVRRLAEDQAWLGQAVAAFNLPDHDAGQSVLDLNTVLLWAYTGLVLATFAARQVRLAVERRNRQATVIYPDGRRVAIARGTSILDASRLAGIPHASVCGGRGRCSTCRVRVGRGLSALAPPSEAERKVLSRVGAAPTVRLACQTRPVGDIEVAPLLPPQATVADAGDRPNYAQGQERDIVVVFVDLRDFTSLSERRLPYDVVFILNRYFAEMGSGIVSAGGRIDKFIGDGIMALFGVETEFPRAARQSLDAARRMAENLRRLNESLAPEIDKPLRIGIGIHGGPVIVGELGYGDVRGLTAIGDTVNTASRLEALTKEHGVQVIVSAEVARAARLDLADFPTTELAVRGRTEAMSVHLVDDGTALPG